MTGRLWGPSGGGEDQTKFGPTTFQTRGAPWKVVGSRPMVEQSHHHEEPSLATTNKQLYRLTQQEAWWRDHSPTLEDHGYKLRSRFVPGWTPSWHGTNLVPELCEDGCPHSRKEVVDAKRTSDGTNVMIKNVKASSKEVELLQMFSEPALRADPTNHCVPILDHFRDKSDPSIEYFVMPLLRPLDNPTFLTMAEVVEFMRQTLEGLGFMHKHGVAHRDCFYPNLLMDGSSLYPKGFHPAVIDFEPDLKEIATPISRSRATTPVKYYFIDFGISSHFSDPEQPRQVKGLDGIDISVPELSDIFPYDPFPVDVYILGNVFNVKFLQVYRNFQVFQPLVRAMTQFSPQNRPSASESLEQFKTIVSKMNGRSLRWPLRRFKDNWPTVLLKDVFHAAVDGFSMLKGVPKLFKRNRPST